MNIQTPWVFYTSAMPTHPHNHPGANKAAVAANAAAAAAGLIPINSINSMNSMNCPPGTPLMPHSSAGIPGAPFGAFNPAPAHHSQLLLAAAAAAYGQQCAAASHLLQHQPQHQHQHQIPNGGYHLKVHKVDDPSIVVAPPAKRKSSADDPDSVIAREIKKAKLETKALKAKRPGFTDERYNETSYYVENGLRKVYPYYFTFTTFTKGRWVGEKILDVFAREFRAHPVEEYERCIKSGTLTVNYGKVDTDYRLKHNDLLANIVHRHEVPVTSDPIEVIHMDEDLVVVNKPASIPVHPCGRYRHNTVVFILAKEHQLKNLRTIHRLDRLTSGLLLFGRSPKKAREMEQQIRNRLVSKQYVCRVEGNFPDEVIECTEPIEVVSYKIGVCKVSKDGKDCKTTFEKISSNGKTSVVLAKPHTGRMHQIRVHLQYLGYPIVNDPLYNHSVFGPEKGKNGNIGKSDEQLIQDLISIHNAENWLGIEGEETGGGGGDIFGMPHPTPTDATASPSSSISETSGTKDGVLGGTIDSKCENSPISVGEPLLDTDNSTVTAKEEIKILYANERGADADQKDVSLEQEKEMDNKPVDNINVTPGKVTVGTQTWEDDQNNVVISASSTLTSGCQTLSESESTSPQVICSNDNNNSYALAADDNLKFKNDSMTYDPHCYECKVRYRDPKPKDLIMYLHAIRYGGPEWLFETKMPAWASDDWEESDET